MDHTFSSFKDWSLWTSENKIFCDCQKISELGERITTQGFIEPLTRFVVKPNDIRPDGAGRWREGLVAFGKNSRIRAVLRLIEEQVENREAIRMSIYAPEALTALAMCLRGLFPRFLGSEYIGSDSHRDDFYPIPHEDLTCLSLKSAAFDLVTTNEVLEHLPSIDSALAEIFRVLRPGGWHVGPTHLLS